MADENNLGKGRGTEAIKSFISMILERHKPEFIIADPSPENKRAIRCYEKVGFQHTRSIRDINGKMVYLMELRLG